MCLGPAGDMDSPVGEDLDKFSDEYDKINNISAKKRNNKNKKSSDNEKFTEKKIGH